MSDPGAREPQSARRDVFLGTVRFTYVMIGLSLIVAGCGSSPAAGTGSAGKGGSASAGAAGVAGPGGSSGGPAGPGGASGGMAGAGGAAGRGGSIGVAGTTGGGGTGVAGSGVAGGGGSSTPSASGPECNTPNDCVIASDCCACRAVPRTAVVHSCGASCKVDWCTGMGIQSDEVTCAFGRCVLARSCVTAKVLCREAAPVCPQGLVNSVLDSCWGPCLPPTQCSAVDGCSSCGAGAVCVKDDRLGTSAAGCVIAAPDCQAGNYCGCLGACRAGCTETATGVGCFCGGC